MGILDDHSNSEATPPSENVHIADHIGPLPTPADSTVCGRFTQWLRQSAWPGMGLFGESYLLFSIGTLKPIWEILFPDCWNYHDCSPRLLHSLTYSVVLGVITGMLLLGYLGNTLGRRNGSILTASFMCGGSLGLFLITVLLVDNPEQLYRMMALLLFVFGIGVGGEYPLSASSASEKAMLELKQKQKMEELEWADREGHSRRRSDPSQTRGRRIQLVFTMQGMGIWLNSLTLMILLLMTGQVKKDNYDENTLLQIWRISYAIGAAVLVFLLISRVIFLQESAVWADDKRRREQLARSIDLVSATAIASNSPPTGILQPTIIQVSSTVSSLSSPSEVLDGYDEMMLRRAPSTDPLEDVQASPTALLFRIYGVRLFGASMSWFLWDIAFYGNKLFQSSFLLALTGYNTTLVQFMGAATLNATVALLGYFGAAFLVDHPLVGRLKLQEAGFMITGTLFVTCGFCYSDLSSKWLVTMYLMSSFFGQLGPNATTFLIPAEIFPTEMRTFCHGICAASGKLGALTAAILFNFMSDMDMFLISGYASFAACAITIWAIPETTGLDLYEIDRKWRMILDGRRQQYEGAANNPMYMSFYERSKLGLQW